jgi:triosephosphate isomerase
MRKPIITGNWKMNKTVPEAVNLISELKPLMAGVSDVDVVVAPTFTALSAVSHEIRGTSLLLSAQDVFWEREGAYTGEISASMLKDVGCHFVILGHSERRQYFGETDKSVNKKIRAALGEGLKPIVCVGESLEERQSGKASGVVRNQIVGCVNGLSPQQVDVITLAYEPVWAIGTGKTATPEQAEEMHRQIRETVGELFGQDTAENLRIQYGGSVSPDNIRILMERPNIDGALVGGASLKSDSFSRIVKFRET